MDVQVRFDEKDATVRYLPGKVTFDQIIRRYDDTPFGVIPSGPVVTIAHTTRGTIRGWTKRTPPVLEGSETDSESDTPKPIRIFLEFAAKGSVQSGSTPKLSLAEPPAAGLARGQPPGETTVLRAARILDGRGGVLEDRDLVVRDGRIAEIGPDAVSCPTDVRNVSQVENLIATTLDKFGRIDILVYATGTNIPHRSLKELTHETWDLMIGTNLTGAFNCTSAVLPAMRQQQSGLIIYLSSGCVQSPDVSGVSYQATKQGLSGLAHGTFQEERENGIRTTVIFPGLCDTPLVLKRPTPTPPEVMAKALQPEDVADTCLFVASLPPRTRVPELVLLPAGL